MEESHIEEAEIPKKLEVAPASVSVHPSQKFVAVAIGRHRVGSSCIRSYVDECDGLLDFRRGISMDVDVVVTNLKSRARMINTSEKITRVGTISANGEREIGKVIVKAMEKVGKEGVITNQELDDPLILIHEKKISNINSIVKVLELAPKRQRPLLIVFEDVESDALATHILNKLCARIKLFRGKNCFINLKLQEARAKILKRMQYP